ncbi:hypothetical protein ElyMa_004309000 [Elysia marginata]|uniref:RNA ligase domain-containing protein n=1 Tax=Elysia marginata TaxID=1093978 RepID=A0AAV4H1C8_9GAST|nr:hypothetical protein ElyMa_004309000 [Elysia marginata]
MATNKAMPFSPMTSIMKKPTLMENNCHSWIATEKVHGASFQFYTSDGDTIHLGSRTRCLDANNSFLKCNLVEFKARHTEYVKNLYQEIKVGERWQHYISGTEPFSEDIEDDEDCKTMAAKREEDLEMLQTEVDGHERDGNCEDGDSRKNTELTENVLEVRVYGELYGGGGVNKDIKPAVQKEIIYSDEFRFYVFGITINKKWVNIVEMNDLCNTAGFPYFATPVCEPMDTFDELQGYITSSGFMNSRSRLTDRSDDYKTKIEGVVMSPLVRPDYRRHAIKLLSAAFTDVRNTGKGKNVQVNYCTKARYLSVISKLDIPEREDTEMVTSMFIQDVEKESGAPLSNNKRKGCVKAVRGWLAKDGYIHDADVHNNAGKVPPTDTVNADSTDTSVGKTSESFIQVGETLDMTELDMAFGDLFGDV